MIKDPIIFYYDDPVSYNTTYDNLSETRTIGLESEIKHRTKWGFINASYSYYRSTSSIDSIFIVESNHSQHKGFPQHKISLTSGIKVSPKFTLAPSFIFSSEKTSMEYREIWWGDFGEVTYPSSFILNTMAHYNVTYYFKISLGVYDILGENLKMSYHSDFGYNNTPLMGREFVLKANYQF